MILGLAMVSESRHFPFLSLRIWWLSHIIHYRCALFMFLFSRESSTEISLYLTTAFFDVGMILQNGAGYGERSGVCIAIQIYPLYRIK